MKKILSYVIEDGKVLVTGDSSKNQTLPVDHKQFAIGDPYWINFSTLEKRREFFAEFLQKNHVYEIDKDRMTIDGFRYWIDAYSLESFLSKEKYYFPSGHPRNLFKEYQDFIKYLHREEQLRKIEERISLFLSRFNIEKNVSEIEKYDEGLRIRISSYSYGEQKYPNFQLLLSPDGKLKFLHFFEQEGEYYSSGTCPMTKHTIQKEINRQIKLLEQFDELSRLFDITL